MMPGATFAAIQAHSAFLIVKKPIHLRNAADLTSKQAINNRPPLDNEDLLGLSDEGAPNGIAIGGSIMQ